MSEKKRKRPSEKGAAPNKRVAIDAPADVVKVKMVPATQGVKPVVASTPGLDLPSSLGFKAYQKSHNARGTELLLHSSDHPVVDYTAREDDPESTERVLKHYVGVYDEKTGELQLMEARHMVMRAAVRPTEDESDHEVERLSNMAMRNELGMQFGTKKAKKAIAAVTENAIGGTPQDGAASADPVQAAVLDSMAEATADMPTREELQAAVDENKPRPKANINATTPAEVYSLEELVGKEELKQLQVQQWQEAVANNQTINTRSRYVSARLAKVVASGDVRKLKVLRYMLLLLDFFMILKPGPRGGKKMPGKDEDWQKSLKVNTGLAESVRRRFVDKGVLNTWHLEKLILHILALALVIDNYYVDFIELKDDLKLATKDMTKYFQELGCTVRDLTDSERLNLKYTKAQAAAHKIARLTVPVKFPTQRMPSSKRR